MTAQTKGLGLVVGQVWMENDDRYRILGASRHRHVQILAIEGERVQIIGIAPYSPRKTWTSASRFGAVGKNGFAIAPPVGDRK